MTSAIYPIEIVRVEAGRIFINRGEGVVVQGDRLELLALGAELRDPQSGESLGESETPVGLAEIVEVSAKFAVARLVAGGLQAGAKHILRAPPAPMAPPTGAAGYSAPGGSAGQHSPVAAPPADNRNFLQR
jgi:hypothetical protein